MHTKKLNAVTLSGLIIGPILGSGILILPPLVYNIAGDWAILAWLTIILVSFIVAFIFGFISIKFPGDGGVTNAVEHVFGVHAKRLASIYLIIGVVFGAPAVLLTAGEYMVPFEITSPLTISYILLPICICVLLTEIRFLGKISFILSSISAVLLFLGGATSLADRPKAITIDQSFDPESFFFALLILFWAIFGWELIGNYSAEVANPQKTIFKAIVISILAISAVDLVVAAAIQWSNAGSFSGGNATVSVIFHSLFGQMSDYIIGMLSLFLCCSTYFLYIGGISRLMSSMSEEKALPGILSKRSKTNIPYVSVLALGLCNLVVMVMIQNELFTLESLLAFANSFLTINALIGIGAGIILIKNLLLRTSGIVLLLFFIVMLMTHSQIISLVLIIMLAAFYLNKHFKFIARPKRAD
ncbi:APC family permease [Paenibacillus contaminans]|uniref:Amino acid permease n=1 Tax=Paenibacillus contaminans TaxID=450362 RepID=A0A329MT63_9BACL|nr:amino acid permease [Paenibacillus contaminans]RAV23179.1 amino acid permease [Paenibacillus contaminans]